MDGAPVARPSGRVPHVVPRRVVDGSVACPARGRVDVVECFLCAHSAGLSSEHEERILCAWMPNEAPPADATRR